MINRLVSKYLFLLIFLGVINLGFAQGDIVFFSDSPSGDTFYDYSWGFVNTPSTLELGGPGNDKFPADAAHPYQGFHSLRLRWKSAPGGDWGMAVAAVGWPGNDVSDYDSLEYWVNGPQAVAQADLPELALEDLSNNKSTRVWLGDYFSGVDGDSSTWQKVRVPLDAFAPGPQNADFTRIKTIFHYQKASDNVEHTLWLDEIRIIKHGGSGGEPNSRPEDISATGQDSRIDLKWQFDSDPNIFGYYIYRAETVGGAFDRLNAAPHTVHLYSDFLGENDRTYFYYVTAVNQALEESPPSDTVSAMSFAMTDDELLTSVQEAAFRFFWDYGHPVSGLARERKGSGETCASGGTGFGLMALVVGAERGFASRDSIAARTLKIVRFLQDQADRFHGAWSHWLNGTTGAAIPFSQFDDGGDLVETSYLVMGLLTARQYFDQNNPVETEIRDRATQMWESVEWDWYRRSPGSLVLYWHWSPNFGWQMNMPIRGFNEAMIVYLLAVASPTHSVPATLYHNGWAGGSYTNGGNYYGYRIWVGPGWGGPLFFTHYTFMGFDPRDKRDQYCNYFDNNRNISLVNREYCIRNPLNHAGYDSLSWGLTASDDPFGYSAHAPFGNDNGTITPTAALSAIPYTPEESMATLKHFYHELGADLWGEFGFYDAFNFDQNWFADSYIAIDQGPIVVMIENYRSQLCWDMFMSNPQIQPMLDALGFTPVGIGGSGQAPVKRFELAQNYPNPFNGETVIRFSLPKSEKVTLEIFNSLGQRVRKILDKQPFSTGVHIWRMRAGDLPSGVYFYRLTAGEFRQARKMLLTR